jgi:VIT1/CCC1 family predicted Fe2+/Mn2+ transporter
MAPRTDIWLQNLLDERDGAALYEGLAALEKNAERAASFAELALGERRHVKVWQDKLEKAGVPVPPDRPSSRVRTLVWLARRLGTNAVIPYIVANEAGDADKYSRQGAEAEPMAAEERAHQQVLTGLGGGRPLEARAAIATREGWHRGGRGGSLRAAIFGINDGLLSNLSLVLGVAGAGAEPHTLLVTGLAGLLGGAFSMAVGEFTSVASQRDILARQVELERRELAEAPEEETAELALIFQQKGLSADQAARIAAELLKNPEHALDTLVREELGLDPDDLGSPWGAAGSSFATFALGATIPVIPFLFLQGTAAEVVAAAAAGVVLSGVGALVGFLAGTPAWKSAARMVGLAALAAGATWALGRLFGAAVG